MIHWTILATSWPAPTYTPYDIVNTLYSVLYVAVIPVLFGASTIFGAWWAWNMAKKSIRK